ncbi:hypothetical protein [Chryseobacterium indologenes]|uniref:hypothetical protein n=1 Tax=Chryseobacterium indologenes TaxID=253 RepID=UPI00162A6419|nr:hypothetical protein [Chryseobacterium indologenes]
MKTLPIIFSTEMVQAVLNNNKRQTRRTQGLEIPNQNPDGYEYLGWDKDRVLFKSPEGKYRECKPKFMKDDILWIRETTAVDNFFDTIYKADNSNQERITSWKPSIHMPKNAARIFLRVIDVDCQRLSDISDEDARAEGIEIIPDYYWKEGALNYMYCEDERSYRREYFFLDGNYGIGTGALANHNGLVASFLSLFAKINSWEFVEKDPWVWVYEFEKTEKPLNFLKN